MKNTKKRPHLKSITRLVAPPSGLELRHRRLPTFTGGLSAVLLLLAGCASHPKPLALDPSTNTDKAIHDLENDLASSDQQDQISVFAEKEYSGARKYLSQAKHDANKEDERDEVLEEVGIARAYLEQAKANAAILAPNLGDIAHARQQALAAGAAKTYNDELRRIDKAVAKITKKGSEKVRSLSLDDKVELQKEYLDLELQTIKSNTLGDAYAQIEGAKKLGAKTISPDTLKAAEEGYKSAEIAIETDRHSATVVGNASKNALEAAMKLTAVTQTAIDSQSKSPEQIALELEQKRSNNVELQNKVQAYSTALSSSDLEKQKLTDSSKSLTSELNTVKAQEAAIVKAEKSFDKNEAEVYRQGDKVLIRLKALNFKAGSSNLPSDSLDLLGKVREVVTEFKPSKIMIEGHTDSAGKAAKNLKLSKERADAVAKYMVSTKAVAGEAISAEGFGPEKPLMPNRTRAGRAMNRRVDLILVPADSGKDAAPAASVQPNAG